MPLRHLPARAAANRDGGIAVILALFMMVCVSLCALAVDVGSLYLERRTVQGAADLAAIAAAGDLQRAEAAARATLAANGFGDLDRLAVIKGRYAADPDVAPAARFTAGLEPYNAVRLTAAKTGRLHFAKSFMAEPEITVSAIGAADAQATFSIGSRLASLNGGIVNALLGALLGGNVSLSAMDYNALLNANVSLDGFLSALAAEVGLTAGTYNSLLDGEVAIGNVLSAAAQAASANGDTQGAQAILRLLSQTTASVSVPLKAVLDLGPLSHAEVGQPHAGLAADVNLMSLLSAAAQAANGQNQIALNLGGAVPGLLDLRVDLAIGEAAQHSGWVAVGQPGATVQTAQTRLRVVAEVGGTGILAGVRVRLPLYIEIAHAHARLETVSCGSGGDAQAVIAAYPAVVRAWIGDVAAGGLSSFGSSVPVSRGSVVQAPLVAVSASAYAAMTNTAATDLTFTQADVEDRVVKTAAVRDFTSSLVGSLLQSADLQVNVLGLGLGLGVPAVKALVLSLLMPVTSLLDPLLAGLLKAVGLHLGEVDVQVNGIRCGNAVLAG